LHCAACAQLYPGQGGDGYGGLRVYLPLLSDFFIGVEDLYYEELFALLLMAIGKELVAVEAFIVFAPLCNFRW
jgi:hypothetical protein